MIITKDHVDKDIWLAPSGNNLRYLKDDKLNGGYYRVIKVARVYITVAEVFPDGSTWREFKIKRSEFNENHYKSGLNAGYYAHLNEDAFFANERRLEAVSCVIDAIKYATHKSSIYNLSMSQLEDLALTLGIKLPD